MSGGDYSDHDHLIRSNSPASDSDLETQGSNKRKGIKNLLKQLDRGLSGRHLSAKRLVEKEHLPLDRAVGQADVLADGAPPEWALLLIGCLLGLATGVCVAAFNRGVSNS